MAKHVELFALPFGKFDKALEQLSVAEWKALLAHGSDKRCHMGRLRERIDDCDDSDDDSNDSNHLVKSTVDYQQELEEKLKKSDCVRKSTREDGSLYSLTRDYAKVAESGETSELERKFIHFVFSEESAAENITMAGVQLRRRLGAKVGLTHMQMWRCLDRVIETGNDKFCWASFDKLITNWFLIAESGVKLTNVDLVMRLLFHATKETVYPTMKNNSQLPLVISSLLSDNTDQFTLEDLNRFLSQIRSLTPHQRARFLRRMNGLTLESTKIAEIKFWAVYFLLVDYVVKMHGVEHVPLLNERQQGTFVGEALFNEYAKSREKDPNSIVHLRLKNEVKYEMLNIVEIVLGTLKGLNDTDNHVELINAILYGIFYCGRMDYVALRTALKTHSTLELDKQNERHNLTMKPAQARLKRIHKLADMYRKLHQKDTSNQAKPSKKRPNDDPDYQSVFKKPQLRKKMI